MGIKKIREKFRGCMLGSMVGDVIGATVEGESAKYISKNYLNIEEILSKKNIYTSIEKPLRVGQFTDDTEMSIGVANWLLKENTFTGDNLLSNLSEVYEPWRRYGPNTERILQLFPHNKSRWRSFARTFYPNGSFGNGSAVRSAPIGLRFYNNFKKIIITSNIASSTTHIHPLAIQGSTIHAISIALAIRLPLDSSNERFLKPLHLFLKDLRLNYQDISKFTKALYSVEKGLSEKISVLRMSRHLGVGVQVYESVPMSLYCFLANKNSFKDVISQAISIGGDTDSIASMAGALSGAFLGEDNIPKEWLEKISEEKFNVDRMREIANKLFYFAHFFP